MRWIYVDYEQLTTFVDLVDEKDEDGMIIIVLNDDEDKEEKERPLRSRATPTFCV